jgi:hypothetical protein
MEGGVDFLANIARAPNVAITATAGYFTTLSANGVVRAKKRICLEDQTIPTTRPVSSPGNSYCLIATTPLRSPLWVMDLVARTRTVALRLNQ